MDENGAAVNGCRASRDIKQVAMHVRRVVRRKRDWPTVATAAAAAGGTSWRRRLPSSFSSTWSRTYCDVRRQKRPQQQRHFRPLWSLDDLLHSLWPPDKPPDARFTSAKTNDAVCRGVSPKKLRTVVHSQFFRLTRRVYHLTKDSRKKSLRIW